MFPLKNIRAIIQPSLASFALSLIVTVAVVGAGLWFTDVRTGVLFNALTFGANTSASTLSASQTTLSQFNDRIFGNTLFNKILFYCVWLFIGCLVYILVSAIIAFGSESVETVEEMNYVHARRQQLEKVFLSRLGVRIVTFVLAVAYTTFFIRLLLPYGVYAVHVGVNQTSLVPALLYIGLGTVVLLASLHIFVVLLRVIALRTRLFDSD